MAVLGESQGPAGRAPEIDKETIVLEDTQKITNKFCWHPEAKLERRWSTLQ